MQMAEPWKGDIPRIPWGLFPSISLGGPFDRIAWKGSTMLSLPLGQCERNSLRICDMYCHWLPCCCIRSNWLCWPTQHRCPVAISPPSTALPRQLAPGTNTSFFLAEALISLTLWGRRRETRGFLFLHGPFTRSQINKCLKRKRAVSKGLQGLRRTPILTRGWRQASIRLATVLHTVVFDTHGMKDRRRATKYDNHDW